MDLRHHGGEECFKKTVLLRVLTEDILREVINDLNPHGIVRVQHANTQQSVPRICRSIRKSLEVLSSNPLEAISTLNDYVRTQEVQQERKAFLNKFADGLIGRSTAD